jgi:lipoprotein-anchoring transpeptidase ErfK/SrfK
VTNDDDLEGTGFSGRLREAATVRVDDAPSANQLRRRGDRRRAASRAATLSAAFVLLGGTATAGVYAGQSAFGQGGTVAPPASTAGPSPSAEPTADVAFHVTVDVTRHRLTVRADDRVVRTLPVTAGNERIHPMHEPRYRVVTEKARVRYRSAPTRSGKGDYAWYVGLNDPEVFFAEPYWDADVEGDWVFGSTNVTNGWIGLRPDDAEWLYRRLEVGDPVTIRASAER